MEKNSQQLWAACMKADSRCCFGNVYCVKLPMWRIYVNIDYFMHSTTFSVYCSIMTEDISFFRFLEMCSLSWTWRNSVARRTNTHTHTHTQTYIHTVEHCLLALVWCCACRWHGWTTVRFLWHMRTVEWSMTRGSPLSGHWSVTGTCRSVTSDALTTVDIVAPSTLVLFAVNSSCSTSLVSIHIQPPHVTPHVQSIQRL